jgi:RNA polymerase sigma factor (sigma-70 family)
LGLNILTKIAKRAQKTEQSDSHLVKECLQGNEVAWSTLIDKYKNLIFSIPVRYGFSQEDAADIFQSVCLDLLLELPRVREPNALAGWLIQVTRNRCFHRRNEQLRLPTTEIKEDETPGTEELESIIAEVQKEQLVRDAMRELSPQCKKLVHLLFFKSPSRPYQQVAHEMGLAAGSIGLTRRRCLEALRLRLEELGL